MRFRQQTLTADHRTSVCKHQATEWIGTSSGFVRHILALTLPEAPARHQQQQRVGEIISNKRKKKKKIK
jgi:hypothetical protein